MLLPRAKPLSFYLGAIDGRCWRGCLSFVFLSEQWAEVEAQWRGEGGLEPYTEGDERRDKREHLVPEEISTFAPRPRRPHPTIPWAGILCQQLVISGVEDEWRDKVMWKALSLGEWLRMIIWSSEGFAAYNYSPQRNSPTGSPRYISSTVGSSRISLMQLKIPVCSCSRWKQSSALNAGSNAVRVDAGRWLGDRCTHTHTYTHTYTHTTTRTHIHTRTHTNTHSLSLSLCCFQNFKKCE